MIRVQASDTEFRWIMPHRIIEVQPFLWCGKNIHGEDIPFHPDYARSVTYGAPSSIRDGHSYPPLSTIRYQGNDKNCSDIFHAKETPEQIAEMVTMAMRPIQIESKP